MSRYVPQRGEIASVNLDPQAGHEQAGRRPVLVLSPKAYNEKTGLAIVCPLTTQIKGYAFEVVVRVGKRESAVLADHVKNVDWVARQARYLSQCDASVLERVAMLVSGLVGAPA